MKDGFDIMRVPDDSYTLEFSDSEEEEESSDDGRQLLFMYIKYNVNVNFNLIMELPLWFILNRHFKSFNCSVVSDDCYLIIEMPIYLILSCHLKS